MNDFTPVDWMSRLTKVLQQTHAKHHGRTLPMDDAFGEVCNLLAKTRDADNTLWWVGNGGSAAICSHLSQDVMGKLKLRSHAFTDTALLTCMTNDFGYEEVYARPLRVMARKGDMLIAISSSGNSENIVKSVDQALERGMSVVTLTGFSNDNKVWNQKADVAFYLPDTLYGTVEVGHMTLLHALIETMFLSEEAQASGNS